MIARRRFVIALGASVLATPFAVFPQQQTKVYRIGFLGIGSQSRYAYRIDALREGLREFGYIEGKNITLDYRWAEGNYDRLPQMAVDLVRLKVDVLVTHTSLGTRAARQASTSVPIVMTDVADAVGNGLVESLARPGGNITGSTLLAPQLNVKRLEMVKEILPHITRVALLVIPNSRGQIPTREELKKAAKIIKVDLREFEVRQATDFEAAFMAIAQSHASAVIILEDPLFTTNTGVIANLSINHRLLLAGFSEFAEAGGVIGYGVNFPELYRRAAYFVDKILRGVNPADIPIEQSTKFELVINMKTAKALGIKIPNSVLVRADKVIE